MHTPESVASTYGLSIEDAKRVLADNHRGSLERSMTPLTANLKRGLLRIGDRLSQLARFVRHRQIGCTLLLPILAIASVLWPYVLDSFGPGAVRFLAARSNVVMPICYVMFGLFLASYFFAMTSIRSLRRVALGTCAAALATVAIGQIACLVSMCSGYFPDYFPGVRSSWYGITLAFNQYAVIMLNFVGAIGFVGSLSGNLVAHLYTNWRERNGDRISHLARLTELKKRLAANPASAPNPASPKLGIAKLFALAWIVIPMMVIVQDGTQNGTVWSVDAMWFCFVFGFLAKNPLSALVATLVAWKSTFMILDYGFLPYRAIPFEWLYRSDQFTNPAAAVLWAFGACGIGMFVSYLGKKKAARSAVTVGHRASIVSEILRLESLLNVAPQMTCILVVDAAKSAEMKAGSDPLIAEYAFRTYQQWIDEHCIGGSGRTVARPGDGAIVAFASTSQALAAAQAMLADLTNFNADRNSLEREFRLRIGLHTGEIMGEVEDVQYTSIIDTASHVQAYADVNGIALTKPALQDLLDEIVTESYGEVDGFPLFRMKSASAVAP